MFCTRCGNNLSDSDAFCSNCGADMRSKNINVENDISSQKGLAF